MTETTTDPWMDASEVTEAGWYWYRYLRAETIIKVRKYETLFAEFIENPTPVSHCKGQFLGPLRPEDAEDAARLRLENERLRAQWKNAEAIVDGNQVAIVAKDFVNLQESDVFAWVPLRSVQEPSHPNETEEA